MLSCDFQPLLGPYHDRELNAESAMRVERHLAECPMCAAELAGIRDLSTRIAAASSSGITPIESVRMHRAVTRAADETSQMPLLRIAGLLTALAASVLIVCGVWLLDTPLGVDATPRSTETLRVAATAPEWERVAVTLRADPRPAVAGEAVFYALRYSSTVDWMLDGLLPKDRKPWAKPKSF